MCAIGSNLFHVLIQSSLRTVYESKGLEFDDVCILTYHLSKLILSALEPGATLQFLRGFEGRILAVAGSVEQRPRLRSTHLR